MEKAKLLVLVTLLFIAIGCGSSKLKEGEPELIKTYHVDGQKVKMYKVWIPSPSGYKYFVTYDKK